MPKRNKNKKSHKNKSRHSSSHKDTSSRNNTSSHGMSKSQQSTLYYILGAFVLILAFSAFFIYLPQIRSKFGFTDSTTVDPATLRGHRARLRRLYEKYNPNKLDEIDDILLKYRGKEKELFKKLYNKYVKPNKKVRAKKREEDREKKRRKRGGIDDDDIIPNDETEEEAAARRRRKKRKK
eukprot:841479_1